jgi:hypothetical protein
MKNEERFQYAWREESFTGLQKLLKVSAPLLFGTVTVFQEL